MVAPRIEDNGAHRLGALYVRQDWQGRGVAHDLMERALAWDSNGNYKNIIRLPFQLQFLLLYAFK